MDKATVESVMALAFELARIREQHGAQSGMYLSEVRALRAEAERLAAQAAPTERDAQDAARYRWLRDGELTADYPYPVMRMGGSRVDDQTIWNEELDAAIDAAMAKD